MSASNAKARKKEETILTSRTRPTQENGAPVEVLYQKLGDRWYAFSIVNGEVYVGSVSEDEANNQTETTRLKLFEK